MQARTNVSPVQLPVDVGSEDVTLEYLDQRLVSYRAPVVERDGPVNALHTYEIHVLLTDEAGEAGYMTYLNDLDTVDDILESTGVGRVILEDGETVTLHPGVTASRDGETIAIETASEVVEGRVYVFVEHQLEERAYRLA